MTRQFIILKPRSICLLPDETTRVAFDREGRILWVQLEEAHYRVGLEGRVIKKRSRWFRELNARDTLLFHKMVREIASKMYRAYLEEEAVVDCTYVCTAEDFKELEHTFQKALARKSSAHQAEKDEFNRIYRPMPWLPPDQFLSIAVQPWTGLLPMCCTSCGGKTPQLNIPKCEYEFRHHLAEVKKFLGRSVDLRRAVFVDHPDFAGLGQDYACKLLDHIQDTFRNRAIYAWADAYSDSRDDKKFAKSMVGRGMKRMYLNVGTGAPALQELLSLPLKRKRLTDRITAFKENGLSVGLMFLAGAGGPSFDLPQLEATAELLLQLPLNQEDRVYFCGVPLSLEKADKMARIRVEGKLQRLVEVGSRAQFEVFKSFYRKKRILSPPKVCLFTGHETIY